MFGKCPLSFPALSRSVANCLRVLGEVDKGEVINIINDFMDIQVRFWTTGIEYLITNSGERQLTKKRRND